MLHGSGWRPQLAHSHLRLANADGDRVSEFQHAVQGMDGDMGVVQNPLFLGYTRRAETAGL